MTIDRREFSQQAYKALHDLKPKLSTLARQVAEKDKKSVDDSEIAKKAQSYCEKSSGLVQGLPIYISTWGLHRLTGDAKKFSIGTASDTQYKGIVYTLFLERLRKSVGEDFILPSESTDISDERSLVMMEFRRYTTLNRLAMQIAKEWSFWAASILGEAKGD